MITVISSPAGFRPVGTGKLKYVFSEDDFSGKTNYRITITLFGLSFDFFPDSDGVITCDIASILRNNLVMSSNVADRFKNTYVTYQGVWEEGSYSAVPMSSNIIYYYIGSNNSFNTRSKFQISASGGPFLLGDALNVWGRASFIEFLNDSDLAADSELRFYPTTGSSVQIGTFVGTTKGLQSFGYTFTISGTLKVKKVSAPQTVYATIPVILKNECRNPLYISWVNDYGGLSSWLFDQDQVFESQISDDGRFKNNTVIANQLTLDEFKQLQSLKRSGAEYGINMKQGAYVVDLTDEDNPIPLFVLPENSSTQTKLYHHFIQVTLRYPIADNILV